MSEEQRDLIWRSMLNADMQARYWGKAVQRRQRLELWLTVAVTVLSLGTVTAWLATFGSGLLRIASVMTAATSAVLTLLKISDRAELMANIATQCNGILSGYEELWAALPDLTDAEAMLRHRELDLRSQEVFKHGVKIHTSTRRVRQTEHEVLRARGLQPST